MVEFEKDAQEYILKVLGKLPSKEKEIMKKEIDYLAEFQYIGRYAGDYLASTGETELTPTKINLTQTKGLIMSAASKCPPSVLKHISEA